eukprot:TRINITY_DN1095_c0_g1_i6.p1 TRINITY_DN1095_c0_g1~~TRINITY_DN1095_c0_g1_i6.p1  ORF type:complete len:263 (-),score=61.16 TRINITY_DN1095_c0_g1_i6:175-963(-)
MRAQQRAQARPPPSPVVLGVVSLPEAFWRKSQMAARLLQLEPESTLHFTKTATNANPSRTLKLKNITNGNVAFKVKTTAPKSYLVRPSSGTLAAQDSQEVQIILQPQSGDGQANNHRFLVQAIAVAGLEQVSREQWNEYQKSKDAIHEQRLSVVLEEQEGDAGAAKAGGLSSSVSGASGAAGAERGLATDNSSSQPLQVKYDELVQYTLMLEKNKRKLEADLAALQGTKGAQAGVGGSYTSVQVFLVALVAFFLAYAAKFVV